jgi:L-alanine-DL-glutamate epimerase-like enolase superfamily enzyme
MSTSKIQKIEATKYSLPLAKSLRSGKKRHIKKADHVLIRVTTDDGITGLGEAMAFGHLFGESQASIAWAVEQWIAPKLKGLPLFAIEKVWDEIDTIRGNNTAKGAVDIAVHDALAKSLGIPLYQLLGGWTDRIALTWIIGQMETEQMVEEGLEAKKAGFKSFKVKVGIDSRKDVEVIRSLREALGDDILIYVDANQAYSYQDACRVIPMMEEFGIAMVEDPIPNWDTEGRTELSRRISVPFIGDGCVTSPLEVKKEIDLGAISLMNVKPPRTGYYLSRKIVHLAEQAGFPLIIGTLLETDIGVLASAHFGAAFKIFSYPAELTYFLKMEDHLLKDPVKIEDGFLILPDKPGLGAELDEEKIECYRQER